MRLSPVRSSGSGSSYTSSSTTPSFAHEQRADARADAGRELEPHGRAEPPAQELLLHRLEQVLGVVLLDLHVLVARDAEQVVLAHLHAREEVVEVLGDDLLDGHERRRPAVRGGGLRRRRARAPARVHGDEPRQQRRHLDPGEVLLARGRVGHDDRQVERQPRDVRERVRRVDGERREHREDLLAEELVQALLLARLELVPVDERDALRGERGLHVVGEHARVPRHEVVRALADRVEHLAGRQARRRGDRDARRHAALEARDAHHEELVQVGREDREEPDALQERLARVLRELEHALVECEPAQLAVGEPVVGQRTEVELRTHLPDLRLLRDVLGDVRGEVRVERALRGRVGHGFMVAPVGERCVTRVTARSGARTARAPRAA